MRICATVGMKKVDIISLHASSRGKCTEKNAGKSHLAARGEAQRIINMVIIRRSRALRKERVTAIAIRLFVVKLKRA